MFTPALQYEHSHERHDLNNNINIFCLINKGQMALLTRASEYLLLYDADYGHTGKGNPQLELNRRKLGPDVPCWPCRVS